MSQASRNNLPRKVKQDGKSDLKPKWNGDTSPSPENSTPAKSQQPAKAKPASEPGASPSPNSAPVPAVPSTADAPNHDVPDIAITNNKENDVTTPEGIARYFTEATKNFERMIQKAVESLVENIKAVEAKLGSAIEYESRRVTEIEEKNGDLEKRMGALELEVQTLRAEAEKQNADINKSERFSRRNNIRIVGIPESTTGKEDCVALVEGIAQEKFGLNIKVERAHRDGKSSQGRSRHILFKTLSYRHKIDIMKNQREKLAKESYYMTDDLTHEDLIEKRKWNADVQELYLKDVKLRFSAGKWRNQAGVPYVFKSTSSVKTVG